MATVEEIEFRDVRDVSTSTPGLKYHYFEVREGRSHRGNIQVKVESKASTIIGGVVKVTTLSFTASVWQGLGWAEAALLHDFEVDDAFAAACFAAKVVGLDRRT